VEPLRPAEVVLEGVLVPVAWGREGEVLDVGLMTFDEEEYRIDRAPAAAHKLRDLLRRHVRLVTTMRDRRVIGVSRVEVLSSVTSLEH